MSPDFSIDQLMNEQSEQGDRLMEEKVQEYWGTAMTLRCNAFHSSDKQTNQKKNNKNKKDLAVPW